MDLIDLNDVQSKLHQSSFGLLDDNLIDGKLYFILN